MESRAAKTFTTRLFLLVGLALVWAFLILCRLFYLQVVHHRTFREQADRQTSRRVELLADRGGIHDRNGALLVRSLQADSVYINPLLVPDRAVAAEILARILELDRQALYDKIQRAFERRRGFLWIARKTPAAAAVRLKSLNLDWIRFRTEQQRQYPKGVLAAHLVGAVDFAQQGNLGLEQSLDADLRGRNGQVRMLADVSDRGIETQVATEPQAGKNVTLTIDERIQFIAGRELKAAVERERCTSGSVVVMNPHNGEILALASFPEFDPNRPPPPGEDPAVRFNNAVSVPFEPGSVFKVVTVAAALETTRLRPETVIPCGNGRINLFGRVVHDHHSYPALTLAEVLAKSSNIGAINVGLKVGDPQMLEYIRRFGFGRKTGLPLPAESAGLVRPLNRWQKTSIASVAMGHEISTTTLQLAVASAVFANGGLLVQPKLILWRQRPGGPVERTPAPAPVRVLKPETAITMRQLMEAVVLNGTGRAARLDGYSAGGKTGTAQIFDLAARKFTHRYNASFMGFAPVTSPAIVVAVTLNGANKYGGTVAAPVFRAIATEALRLLSVPKDVPEARPAGNDPVDENDLAIADLNAPATPPPAAAPAPAAQPQLPVLVAAARPGLAAGSGPVAPDFQGKSMRAVLRASLAMGLRVEINGSGIARGQAPAPGSPLSPGQPVRIEFAP
ncbi:MAG: penicillin-binding protein [Acidobacteriota bacterium]|mgnify:CR=1 FL=1